MKKLVILCLMFLEVMIVNAQQVESYPDSQRYLFNQYNPLDSLLDSNYLQIMYLHNDSDCDSWCYSQRYDHSNSQQAFLVYGISFPWGTFMPHLDADRDGGSSTQYNSYYWDTSSVLSQREDSIRKEALEHFLYNMDAVSSRDSLQYFFMQPDTQNR